MVDVRTYMHAFTAFAALLLVVSAGCGNKTCDKFVEMSMSCPDKDFESMSDDEKKQTKSLLVGMCEGAMNDSTAGTSNAKEKAMVKEMNATIRKKAECVAAAKTCGDAAKCDASDD